jgi:hypothetical protein
VAHGWAVCWQRHAFKVGTLVTVLVFGFIGYETLVQHAAGCA